MSDEKQEQPTENSTDQNINNNPEPKTIFTSGIDFGSTKMVMTIASKMINQKKNALIKEEVNEEKVIPLPQIVQNELNSRETPTMVAFKDNERKIGEDAVSCMTSTPNQTFLDLLRLVGEQTNLNKDDFAFQIENDPQREGFLICKTQHNQETHSLYPEQLVGHLLEKTKGFSILKNDVPASQALPVCLAVPACFSKSQRAAFYDAAQLSGLEPIAMTSTITSAALCFGVLHPPKAEELKTILFLEMGHTFFSAQVVRFEKQALKVLACVSDATLGARIFDDAIFEISKNIFKVSHSCFQEICF